jgi:replicative DNA helicase Mcm
MGEQDTSSLVSVFEDFFTNIHKEKINDVLSSYPSTRSVDVDFGDIDKFDTAVADQLIHEPEVVIDAAEEAIRNLNLTLPPGVGEFTPHVRFFNGPGSEIMIERLSSQRLNELVTFKGIVTKRTDVMHKVKIAHFTCQACNETYNVQVARNFKPPRMCSSCKKLALVPNEEKSKFADIQKAEAQDLLEKVTGGSPAAKIELWFEDDLVNKVTPGENVEATGILRIKPTQNMKQKNELVFNRYVEVVHINSLKRDFEEIHLSKEDIAQIKELSRHPDIIERIFGSIAPAVYGYSEVKKALALQLFGGTKGKLMKGRAAVRDDIHVLLIGDPGIAKCADGDSEVLLADGSLCRLGEVVEEVLSEKGKTRVEDGFYATSNHDLVSLGLDATLSPSKATHFWKLEAPAHMYEVETGTGRKVTVTPEHPFFISRDGHIASKPASGLREGEFISTPRNIPIRGAPQPLPRARKGKTNARSVRFPKHLDKNFARLIGYLSGDGYFRKTSSYEISLTNNDKELLSDFGSILASFDLKTKTREDKRTGAKTSFAFSVELGSVLSGLGMEGKTARTKTIPQAILRSPNEVASEFVKAYFDCDATVGKEGITAVSASRGLLSRIQLLLLRFGIISQLHKTTSRAANTASKTRRTYFRLFILGENAKKYAKHIGFNCRAKSRKLSAFASMPDENFNTNMDVIPNLSKILKETRTSLGLAQAQCGVPRPTYAHFEQGNRNPSRRTLRKIVSAFIKAGGESKKSVRLLSSLSNSHVFWDKVSKIRRIKPRGKWVYDLQVDPTHNFIANGMVVHNTRFLNSTSALAPKSMYVSGKSVSGVGLCVGEDSLVQFNDAGLWELGEYVERNFGEPREELPGAFSSKHDSRVATLDPSLSSDFAPGTKIWRIEPPPRLVRLVTRRGKKLTLTPQTPVLVFGDSGIEWKKSRELTGSEFIATSRSLPPLEGKDVPVLPLITSPNVRIADEFSCAMREITGKLAKKYGNLTIAAERLGIRRNQFYEWRIKKYSRGILLDQFRMLAGEAGIPPAELPTPSRLFCRYGKEISLPGRITPELARFAGLIAADGDIYSGKSRSASVRFHNSDAALLESCRALAEKLFGIPPKIINDGERVPCVRINSFILAGLMASLGIPSGKKSHLLDVPPALVSSGKECMAAYLQALFDCDGWVSRPKKGSPSIGLTTCSEKLARKVLLLLEWWGIAGKVRTRDKRGSTAFINGKKVESKRIQYQVEVRGAPNFRRFNEHIGFTITTKRDALSSLLSGTGNPNLDIVPVSRALSIIKSKYSLPSRVINPFYCTGKKFPGREKLLSIANALEGKPEAEWLRTLAESDVYWDRISSIETVKPGSGEKVYDLTVDGNHAFFANGILVHNTASAEKDELGDGGWTLKAGALVLASGGIGAIDEFDKIDEEDRASLHEVMESQSVSIAKAGIVAKFRAKTAIVAAANPKHGRFNQTKNLADQFDVPPSLLSRFDLIFPILDVLDEEKDLKLADHILTSHIEAARGTFVEAEELLDRDILRKYIAYARRYVHPVLSDSAKDKIKEFYLDLRRRGKSSGSVPITPRYLEGLVRLSEAHAKIRLSNNVELEDAVVAVELMDHVLRKVMTDQETGKLDVDIISTGRSRSQVVKVETILDIIKEKTRDQEAVPRNEVLDEAESTGMDRGTAKRILQELMHKGEVYEKEPGWIALVGNR